MKHRSIVAAAALAVAGIVVFNSSGLAIGTTAGPALREQADEAYLHRAADDQAKQALALYRELYRAAPDDPENAWRLSMACYFVGTKLAGDRDERRRLFGEGRDAGLAAVRREPESAAAHFWTAVNMALYGENAGAMRMLASLGEIRRHLETVVKLDPGYAYGGAYRIMGKIDESLPHLAGGNINQARELYEKAIAVAPDEPLNYLFLARLLHGKFGNERAALEIAKKGLALTVTDESRYESIDSLRELREFIGKNE